MSNHVVLEICVESVDHAIAAEDGGADRLELCSDLSSGGITPSAGLMQTAGRHLTIPIHVLIRPRAGGFSYSDREFETMCEDIRVAKQAGMSGVVSGVLKQDGRVDVERTKRLVELAHPLPVTFHRAFDLVKNRAAALEDVVATGAARILTSGGKSKAADALTILNRLVTASNNRVGIMPCGGVNSTNITRIVRTTLACEIHTSVGISHSRSNRNGDGFSQGGMQARSDLHSAFERKVAQLAERLRNISRDRQEV